MVLIVPVLLVLGVALAVACVRWLHARRRDEKSIRAHRSTLGVIEHVAGADDQPARPADRPTGHVRIVGSPAPGAAPRPAEGVLPARPA